MLAIAPRLIQLAFLVAPAQAPAQDPQSSGADKRLNEELQAALAGMATVSDRPLEKRHKGKGPCLRYAGAFDDRARVVSVARDIHKAGITAKQFGDIALTEKVLTNWQEAEELAAHGKSCAEEVLSAAYPGHKALTAEMFAPYAQQQFCGIEGVVPERPTFEALTPAQQKALRAAWTRDRRAFWDAGGVERALQALEEGRDPMQPDAWEREVEKHLNKAGDNIEAEKRPKAPAKKR